MSGNSSALFREEQRFRQPSVRILPAILPAGFTLLLIWQVLLGQPAGPHPLGNGDVIGWTIFLWLIYLRLITIKLVTTVEAGRLSLSLRGLWKIRKIALAEVAKAEPVTYVAADYGGYGIRLTKYGKAYIASGDRSVRLTLANGGKVLVGSQRAEELAQTITVANMNV